MYSVAFNDETSIAEAYYDDAKDCFSQSADNNYAEAHCGDCT